MHTLHYRLHTYCTQFKCMRPYDAHILFLFEHKCEQKHVYVRNVYGGKFIFHCQQVITQILRCIKSHMGNDVCRVYAMRYVCSVHIWMKNIIVIMHHQYCAKQNKKKHICVCSLTAGLPVCSNSRLKTNQHT